MSSAPAMLDAPVFPVAAFPPPGVPDLVFNDVALRDGAASVWVTLKYARKLPATPETQASLEKAEALFLAELGNLGLTAADLDSRLDELRESAARRGSPLGA
jgi:hypothetical protein